MMRGLCRKQLSSLTVLCLLTACQPTIAQHGNVIDEDQSWIAAGLTSRDEVLQRLGSPSTAANFGDETWYYIRSTSRTKAFLKPSVSDQEVLELHFDADGRVASVERYTSEDGKKVEFAKAKTPTTGQRMGAIQQLLGNVGRFNKDPGPRMDPGKTN
jgi:outer membrane protein assembly factor BamE (lipoprotein component of BamABCDE complex)